GQSTQTMSRSSRRASNAMIALMSRSWSGRMEDDLGQSPTDEDVASIKADFEVIADDHSMEALKDCRRDYERNPLFTHATVHPFVDPDSLEARAAARGTSGL